jgi:hypothetical protein
MLMRLWINWNPCTSLAEVGNGVATVENTVLQIVKHSYQVRYQFYSYIYICIPQRTGNEYSSMHVSTHVHRCTSHNSQNAEAALISTNV